MPRRKFSENTALTSSKPAGKRSRWRLTSPLRETRSVLFIRLSKPVLKSLLDNFDKLPQGTVPFIALFLPYLENTSIDGDFIYTEDPEEAKVLKQIADVFPHAIYSDNWEHGGKTVQGVLLPPVYSVEVKCPFCGYKTEYMFTTQLMSSTKPSRCPSCGTEVTVEDIASIGSYIIQSGERIIAHRDSKEEYEIKFVKVREDLYLVFWKQL